MTGVPARHSLFFAIFPRIERFLWQIKKQGIFSDPSLKENSAIPPGMDICLTDNDSNKDAGRKVHVSCKN